MSNSTNSATLADAPSTSPAIAQVMSLGSNQVEANGTLNDDPNVQKSNTLSTKNVSDCSNALSVCSAITDELSTLTGEVISQKGQALPQEGFGS